MTRPFAVGIVAHDSREKQAKKLARTMRANTISIDDGTLGCSGNHLAVIERLYAEHDADWIVVLEDDAEPVRAPIKHVTAALESAPRDRIISFYLGTSYPQYWQRGVLKAVEQAKAKSATWITSDHLLHAVAYAVPRRVVPSLLDSLRETMAIPIDEAITDWARKRPMGVAYTFPSLFDHRDDPTVLVPKDGIERVKPRKAHLHGVPAHWTPRTVDLEFC